MADIEQAPRRGNDPKDAGDSSPDPQNELKKRARRRLVGATALALLAVIVLPMVMDQEPKQATQDIQVRIPSQDAGTFTSRILPAKPAATPLPPVESQAAAAKPSDPVAPAKPEVKVEAPATKPAEPVAKSDKPAEKTAEKPVEKPAEKSPEKPVAKGDDPRAKALLDGAGGQWIIQLGAYQEQGNVRVLQNKVKELGYPSYTEKVTTAQGPRIRVRAGPFSSREAAEKAQGRLKKIGAGGPNGGLVAQK